ncbi:MAG: iron ABC transporter permease [Treponema sp.]|jgi:thiamine transport system permease protein|nr:iron ABC transporter permease [Treponema sp.]
MGRSDAISRYSAVWLLSLLPVLAAAFAFVLPYGASFAPLIQGGNAITVWKNAALFSVTLFTLKQAFFSVLVSLALGLPGAWFIGNSHSRFAPFLRTITAVPFAMPSILVVLGFVLFFGNSGWVNRIFINLTGADEGPLRILYKPEAIILAHGFFNFPLVIGLVGDGLARARRAYAPAAASMGASPTKTALTVILPLAVPSLMSAILLVFLYCFTSFAVVLVLGGGPASTTIAVEIYRHARIFLNYHNAAALALVETLIAVSLFLTYTFFGRKYRMIKTDVHERIETDKRSPVSWTILIVYCLVMAFFILGPLLSIPLESLLYRPSRSADQVLSLRWWQSLGDTCLPALVRSLTLAFFSATTACILAVLAAGSVKLLEEQGRGNSAWVNIVRFFAAAPIVSSGIVLGLGWIILYGRNFSRAPLALVILHAVSALPFAFNFISEGFRSLPGNILSAASVFGAGPLRGLLTTALPLSLPRIRSAWGFAAALSLGELNAVMMLGMEGWETLPLYIYRAVGAYRYGTACAAGTLLILGCAACFFLSETGKKKHA